MIDKFTSAAGTIAAVGAFVSTILLIAIIEVGSAAIPLPGNRGRILFASVLGFAAWILVGLFFRELPFAAWAVSIGNVGVLYIQAKMLIVLVEEREGKRKIS